MYLSQLFPPFALRQLGKEKGQNRRSAYFVREDKKQQQQEHITQIQVFFSRSRLKNKKSQFYRDDDGVTDGTRGKRSKTLGWIISLYCT